MAQSVILTSKIIKRESEAKAQETINAAEAAEASEVPILFCCILTHAASACGSVYYCVGVRVCL